MAQRWLRGPVPNLGSPGDGSNDYAKVSQEHNHFVYYFFRRLLGFAFVDEDVSAGKSFENGHSANGSDGILTAVDYSFNAASGSFLAGDVGKFLVLVDSTNAVNCGIFEITSHISDSQIEIDFQTTDFPTAATGIDWYLLDPSTYTETVGDTWVLNNPHSTSPHQIRGHVVGNSGQNFNGGTVFEVSVEAGAWDTVGNDWLASADRIDNKFLKIGRGDLNQAHGPLFAYGDTDGSFWILWGHHNNGTGNKMGCITAVLNPLETTPARTAKETIYVCGTASGSANQNNWNRNIGGAAFYDSMAHGHHWSERQGAGRFAAWCGWGPSTEFFNRNQQANVRTGNRDAFPIWVFVDPAGGAAELWAPLGEMPTAHIVLATVHALGEHVTFDSNNFFHIRDGVVVPWPGVAFP